MITYVINISSGDKYDVYIGRGTCWGNPFYIGVDGTRDEVIAKYKTWIYNQPELIEKARKELIGQILCCHCFPLNCHGDILVEICEG